MKPSYLALLLLAAAPAHAESATLESMTADLLRHSSTFQTYMSAHLRQLQNYSINLPSSLGDSFRASNNGQSKWALGGSLQEWDPQGRPTGAPESFDLRVSQGNDKVIFELRMANETEQPAKISAMKSSYGLFENYDSLAGNVESTIPTAEAEKAGACGETVQKAADRAKIRSAFECEGDNNLTASWASIASAQPSIPTHSCVLITDDSLIVTGRSPVKGAVSAAEFVKLSLKGAANTGGNPDESYVSHLRFSPQGEVLAWSDKNEELLCGDSEGPIGRAFGQSNYSCEAYLDVNVSFSPKTGELKVSTQPRKYSFFHAVPDDIKATSLTKTCKELRLP